MRRIVDTGAWAAAALLFIWLFHLAGQGHDRFDLRYVGANFIDTRELVFFGYLGLLGTLAVLCATGALLRTGGAGLHRLAERALRHPTRVTALCAGFVLIAALLLRHLLLLEQPVADDELTYDFIARTLLEGRIVNPIPLPAEFLKNQFTVINEHGWFGKYPPGHPALLALGMLLHASSLVVPLLGALGVALTYRIGRELFSPRRAVAACLLLTLSPQYVGTHATQLSQTTSMVCMLLGMLGLLRLRARGGARLAFATGLALAFGVLARPLPGVLFVGVAGLFFLAERPRPLAVGRLAALSTRARESLPGALPLIGCALVLLWFNTAQSGGALRSGYHEAHELGLGVMQVGLVGRLSSLGDALLRLSFWFLGWPLAILFVALARPRRAPLLFWGLLVAECAYRLTVPKTVVATTGPIYMMEIVPLLALATADGMARLSELLDAAGKPGGPAVASLMLAGTLVSAACFLPVQVRAIAAGAEERQRVFDRIDDAQAERPLVFAFDNLLVLPQRRRTWAYYAPSPSPDLQDRLLFLRAPPDDSGFRRVHALWQERFAERRAFVLLPAPQGPVLRELSARSGPPGPP